MTRLKKVYKKIRLEAIGLKTIGIETVSVVGILLLGAYLRLWHIRGYMTFLGDEGRDVLVVKRILVDHDMTFLGPTASVGGFFLGPIYYYFMTPFLWLSRLDPVGPAIMVALFGVATIYFLYRFSEELFDTRVAIIASSLYALSPLVIAQSRSSWNPNIVPFFSLFLMYSLWKSVKTHNKWWYFSVGLMFGIGLQLHYLFTFLIPVALIYILLFDRSIKRKKEYLFSFSGIIAGIFPFLAFEIKNKFPNTQTIIRFILAGDEVGTGVSAINQLSDVVFRLFARLVFFYPPPEQVNAVEKPIYAYWQSAVILTIVSSVTLLVWNIYKKKRKQDILLGLWLLFGVGLFSLYQKAVYDYYFVIMFTLPFILIGCTFSFMWGKKYLKPVALAAFIGLIVLNWNGRPFKHEPNRQVDQVAAAARSIFDRAGGKPFNFALITGSNSDHAYRYFMEIWGNSPVTIENFEVDPDRKTVTTQLFVICEYHGCQPLGNPLWEIAGFGQAEIVEEWASGPLKAYKLVPLKLQVVQ